MVIHYLFAELYVSIFLITPILHQGILELLNYGGLVINSKELLGDPFEVTTHSNNRNSKSSREVILGSVRL